MASQKFTIDIHARDKTREGLESAAKGFGRLAKGTPLEPLNRGFREIREKFEGLSGVTRAFHSIGDASSIAGGGISEAGGAMSALGEAAGVAGLATAGVAAGLGMATVAAFKYEEGVTKGAAATGRFADEIGMSAQQLQAFQLAGAKVGVTADGMASALQSVGNTMQAARVSAPTPWRVVVGAECLRGTFLSTSPYAAGGFSCLAPSVRYEQIVPGKSSTAAREITFAFTRLLHDAYGAPNVDNLGFEKLLRIHN